MKVNMTNAAKDVMKATLASIEMGAPGSFEARKLDRYEINGLIVSTVWTTDMGYETALLDRAGAHPVERYSSKEEALDGHERWCKQAATIEKCTMLGYGTSVDEEEITLQRVL